MKRIVLVALVLATGCGGLNLNPSSDGGGNNPDGASSTSCTGMMSGAFSSPVTCQYVTWDTQVGWVVPSNIDLTTPPQNFMLAPAVFTVTGQPSTGTIMNAQKFAAYDNNGDWSAAVGTMYPGMATCNITSLGQMTNATTTIVHGTMHVDMTAVPGTGATSDLFLDLTF